MEAKHSMDRYSIPNDSICNPESTQFLPYWRWLVWRCTVWNVPLHHCTLGLYLHPLDSSWINVGHEKRSY